MKQRNIAHNRQEAKVLNDLRIMALRIDAAGRRRGLHPAPAYFQLKSDQQILDDIVYAGLPRHYKHWRYGKQAMQPRNGHVFEFALNSDPAHIALGSTNNLTMQILVMIHAWMGHVQMDQNAFFRETEPHSVIQKFAQDEHFVDMLIEKWGHERYEYFMDAAHALEMHCGWLPTNRELMPDPEHRRMLEKQLQTLAESYHTANTDYDRKAVLDEWTDTRRMLQCHPIVPTDDFLLFLSDPENTPKLPSEAQHLLEMVREEHRYHQAFMRTRYFHEGWSHFWDTVMPDDPEIDMLGLGWSNMFETVIANTMHDSYPIYWFHDVYAFGLHLWQYVDQTYSRKTGTEVVHYTRLKTDDEGHVIDTGIEAEKVVDVWDRSYMMEVHRTFNDRRFFETFINDDSMAILNNKALEWVRRTMGQINKRLRDSGWDSALIFDPLPETLEDMYYAITVWYQQRQMSGMMRGWFGYGAPPFPIHEIVLGQMLQIVQTVAEWDTDKNEYKRQMVLYTDLSFMPNLRIVDSGRFSQTGFYTIRHEYDPDFGPLAQNDARETLRRFWRLAGPVQLLTWEILVDDFGRPWGPPRPYRYFCDNGETVKERWL